MQGNLAITRRESVANCGELNAAASGMPRLAALPAPLTVAVMTPWDQQCGNAEYAKRLAVGLERFATVLPFEMLNLIDGEKRTRRNELDRYFDELVARVNASTADLIHIQHEFCFFGRRIGPSNRRFLKIMKQLRKPVVVTLHTWLKSMTQARRNRISSQAVERVRHGFQNRHIAAALRRADAIVLHSKDTYKHFVETFPSLKKRVHVVPIPIERSAATAVEPAQRKHQRDTWVIVPGFVSRYKGHAYVLAALRHLPENFKLVVAGGVHPKDRAGNDYWMDLIQQADAWGLQSRVIFTGFLADAADQAAVLEQADVFILPYDEVGQSGSAVLADVLSYDCPVITSRARSMFVYRMDKDTAFSSVAVDVGDAKEFAATIRKCTRFEPESFAEARQHRATARQRYSLASTQTAYEQIYRRLLVAPAS
jgi:glycosyltransferase involved in cell wall biosynthesis